MILLNNEINNFVDKVHWYKKYKSKNKQFKPALQTIQTVLIRIMWLVLQKIVFAYMTGKQVGFAQAGFKSY